MISIIRMQDNELLDRDWQDGKDYRNFSIMFFVEIMKISVNRAIL